MARTIAALAAAAAVLVNAPAAAGWSWPVDGPVLRPFVFGDDPYAAGQHRGVDIGAAAGTPVRAAAAGTVSFAGAVPSGGRAVTVRTADGLSVTYLELGAIRVERAAEVAEGELVGTVGPAAHLHFGVRVTADPQGYLDPLLLLPPRTVASARADPVEGAPVAEAPERVPDRPAAQAPAPEAQPPAAEEPHAPPAPREVTAPEPVAEAAPAPAEGAPAAGTSAAERRGATAQAGPAVVAPAVNATSAPTAERSSARRPSTARRAVEPRRVRAAPVRRARPRGSPTDVSSAFRASPQPARRARAVRGKSKAPARQSMRRPRRASLGTERVAVRQGKQTGEASIWRDRGLLLAFLAPALLMVAGAAAAAARRRGHGVRTPADAAGEAESGPCPVGRATAPTVLHACSRLRGPDWPLPRAAPLGRSLRVRPPRPLARPRRRVATAIRS